MYKTTIALATAAAGILYGQATPDGVTVKPRTMVWDQKAGVAGAPQEATIGFIAAEGAAGFAGSSIKGAPYSATVEHTFTQVLADGTRIERKTTSKSARDSEGRTRTESSPSAVGPVPVDLPTMVFIHDPVGKQTIILNDKDKTARVMKMPDMETIKEKIQLEMAQSGAKMRTAMPSAGAVAVAGVAGPGPGGKQDVLIERHVEMHTVGDGAGNVAFTQTMPAPPPGATVDQQVMMFRTTEDKMATESLGVQTVSGVACNAKRSVNTIPVGQIGNDRPIEIVTESCFSDELKTMLSSHTNDPMHGESAMTLSGISRAEPAASLFEVPAGYTVKEGPQPMMFERKIERK